MSSQHDVMTSTEREGSATLVVNDGAFEKTETRTSAANWLVRESWVCGTVRTVASNYFYVQLPV